MESLELKPGKYLWGKSGETAEFGGVEFDSRSSWPLFQHNKNKMLYLIGLGLSDETDITVKGLEIVKKASRVYLEAYTSILLVDKAVLVRISGFV
jgi:hypothetical protein